MDMGVFATARKEFLDGFERKLCFGTKADCQNLVEKNGECLAWGEEPTAVQLKDVKSVGLRPSIEQAQSPTLPSFLGGLPFLRSLQMPQPLIHALSPSSVPKQLNCLFINYNERFGPRNEWKKLRWTATPLPGVRGLHVYNSGPSAAWADLGITAEHLPNLAALLCEIDGRSKALDCAAGFTEAKYMELQRVKDLPVFETIPTSIEVLEISGPNPKFSFVNITRMTSLRSLRINGSRAVIDCALLMKAPTLVEVEILNITKLTNIESLLENPRIESVFFFGCGKALNEATRERLQNRGFRRLEIIG
jgi:hypothetical protein